MQMSAHRFAGYILLALCTCPAAYGLVFFPHPHRPEIDPSLAISALTLLVGSIAVLSVRRKK